MQRMFVSLGMLVFYWSCLKGQSQVSLQHLDWLSGRWERLGLGDGKQAFEEWEWVSGALLVGKGWTTRGADTLSFEKLALLVDGTRIFYQAEVSHNHAPVRFEVIQSGSQGFISSNPVHDFPKEITYSVTGDRLTATISGDGKSISFYFRKVSD
jgi:hypothetical protein